MSTFAKPVVDSLQGDEVLVQEILVPTDLRPRAEAAYAQAALLAARLGAHVTIYHALEREPRPAPGAEDPRVSLLAAGQRLKAATTAFDVEPACVVHDVDDARDAVLRCLSSVCPDLVVLPTHGREGLLPLSARTISDVLLQRAPCPVLCVRAGASGAHRPYERILLPCDLSGDSRRALPIARLLARAFAAEVIGLYVVPLAAADAFGGTSLSFSGLVPAQNAARDFFAAGRPPLRTIVREGSVAEQILDAAREERADLIVLSSHRHDSLLDRMLGSHAEQIVRHAECPVLVV